MHLWYKESTWWEYMWGKVLLCLFAVLFSGCALTPEKAADMSNYDLCSAYVDSLASQQSKRIAEREMQRRGYYCGVATMSAMKQEQVQQGLKMIRMSNEMMQPKYIPVPINTSPTR